jgi:hypothetical protein
MCQLLNHMLQCIHFADGAAERGPHLVQQSGRDPDPKGSASGKWFAAWIARERVQGVERLPRSISTEELDCLNPVPHSKLAATAIKKLAQSKKLAASRAAPQPRQATVPSPATEKIAITTSLRPGL